MFIQCESEFLWVFAQEGTAGVLIAFSCFPIEVLVSFIDFSCDVKCPICQLLFVVVVLVNCFLCLFMLPLLSAIFVSSVTSLHRLINHKALYLLYLVDRDQAREKWSHGFFHLGLRAMSIIKSQSAYLTASLPHLQINILNKSWVHGVSSQFAFKRFGKCGH